MKTISICFTSDIHGYIMPTNYRDKAEENFGLAKIASILDEIKRDSETLLIDNGDFIQGSPLTYYFAKKATDQKNPMIKVANQLQYDIGVIGNHEFNYGMDYLHRAVEESNHPWLSANIVNKTDNEPFLGKPYVIKEIAGIRIAVLGMTTHYIPNWEDPNHIKDLHFEDVVESTKKWVPLIHELEKPDIMIVCYHGGLERDLETGEPTENLTGENQAYQLCQEVAGIDLILTGHQHRFLTGEINGVAIVQSGSNGQAIAEIKIDFDEKIQSIQSILHYVEDETKPDMKIVELVREDESHVQQFLDQTITMVKGDMTITDPVAVRRYGHPFIHYINQLQMNITGVDISCTALFHDKSPGFPNQVTMRDIVANYIFPNTLKVVEVSGHDIKSALEKSAGYFQVENDQLVVNPSFVTPKPQPYNYDMWQGIYYEINVSNPVGERVTTLNYHGKPLNPEQKYQVVMNNYRASGGGDYHMISGKRIVQDVPIDMTELISNDLLKRETLEAEHITHFKILTSN